jgi:hypothetical protein
MKLIPAINFMFLWGPAGVANRGAKFIRKLVNQPRHQLRPAYCRWSCEHDQPGGHAGWTAALDQAAAGNCSWFLYNSITEAASQNGMTVPAQQHFGGWLKSSGGRCCVLLSQLCLASCWCHVQHHRTLLKFWAGCCLPVVSAWHLQWC